MLIGQYTVLRHIQPGHKNAQEYSGAVLVVLSAVLVPIYAIIKKKFFSDRQQEQHDRPGKSTNSHPRTEYEQITDRPIR